MQNYEQNVIHTVMDILSKPNALDYNNIAFLKEHGQGTNEINAIAEFLCGGQKTIAVDFMMNGKESSASEEYIVNTFLHNVSFNSEDSNPVILRAINIRFHHIRFQ